MHNCSRNSARNLKPGDHLCTIYQNDEELLSVLTEFINGCLSRHEKILFLSDERSARDITGSLRAAGLDLEPCLASGQMSILSSKEAYLRQGSFNPESIIDLIKKETNRAVSEGYAALAIAGDMNWALLYLPRPDMVIEYEAKLNEFFQGNRCLAVCQYDQRKFCSEVLMNILHTHPLVIIGSEVHDNFYYAPPEEIKNGVIHDQIFRHAIKNLLDYRRMDSRIVKPEGRFSSIVSQSGDGISLVSEQGNVIEWNCGAEKITGLCRSDVIGKAVWDVQFQIVTDERKTEEVHGLLKDKFLMVTRTGSSPWADGIIEAEIKRPDGVICTIQETGFPIRTDKGFMVCSFFRDITKQKKAEEILRESEKTYRLLADNASDVIWKYDLPSKCFTYFSPSVQRMRGYTVEESLKQSIEEYVDRESLERISQKFQTRLKRFYSGDESARTQTDIVRQSCKDGSWKHIEILSTLLSNEGGDVTEVLGVSRDISERMEAKNALHMERNRFQILSENSPFGMVIIEEDGTISYINPKFKEMIGYDQGDIPTGRAWFRKAFPDPKLRHLAISDWISDLGSTRCGERRPRAYQVTCKDGGEKLINFIAVQVENRQNLLFCEDITEYKKAEEGLKESERRLADIINFLPDATLVIDRDGKIIAWNRAIETMLGVKAEEMLGKGDYEYSIPFYGHRRPILIDLVLQSQSTHEKEYANMDRHGGTLVGEAYIPNLNDGKAYLWGAAAALYDSKGNIVGAIESIRDITDRKQADEDLRAAHAELEGRVRDRTAELARSNEMLRDEIAERKSAEAAITTSLNEKDVLLREIHHRVKNNLQIISSLLYLQSKKIEDESMLQAFQESQNRIKSMALIHESLYRSGNLAKIEFKTYIKSLSDYLFQSYGIGPGRIGLKIEVDDIKLGIDTAIPCGLIINELISNSIKHGVPSNGNGEIHIGISPDGEFFDLIVSDNGPGLPQDLDILKTGTLGLKLVSTLVNQLDGTLKIDKMDGARFSIRFKELKYKERN